MSGCCAVRAGRRATVGSMRKSSSRCALDHLGPGDARRCASAARRSARTRRRAGPGPPKASSRHCSTSLEPLAQNTSSGVTPCRSATAWPQLGGRSVGVAVEGHVGPARPAAPRARPRAARRGLVGVEAHLGLDLGRVVALGQLEVGTDRTATGAHGPSGPSARSERHDPERQAARTESAWAGSPSVSASVTTCGPSDPQRVGRHPHRVDVLAEVVRPQRRGEARRAVGRQDVVGAGDVVAHAGRRPRAR